MRKISPLFILTTLVYTSHAFAGNAAWNIDGSGSWRDDGNWTPATGFPQTNTEKATLGVPGVGNTSNHDITINGATTINEIEINNASQRYRIIGSSTLTFDGVTPTFTVTNIDSSTANSPEINCPVSIATILNVNTVQPDTGGRRLTINGSISGAGGLTKTGEGDLFLTGSNTFTSAILIQQGQLEITTASALPTGATIEIIPNSTATRAVLRFPGLATVGSGKMLDLRLEKTGAVYGRVYQSDTDLSFLGVRGGGQIHLSENHLFEVFGTTDRTFSGIITDQTGGITEQDDSDDSSGSRIIKRGTHKWTLTDSGAGTFTATRFFVNEGTLNVQKASALGAASDDDKSKFTRTVFVKSGAVLELEGSGFTLSKMVRIAGTGIGMQGALRNISGNNTINRPIGLTAHASIGVDAGSLSLAREIFGSFNLTKVGVGNLILGAVNTHTGTTTVSAGTLTYGTSGAIPMGNQVNVDMGGTLCFNAGTDTFPFKLQLDGTTKQGANSVTVTEFKGTAPSANLQLGSNNAFCIDSATDTAYLGTITGGSNAAQPSTTSGNRFVKKSTNKLILDGASTHVSPIFIEAGSVVAKSAGALGAASATSTTDARSGVFIYDGAQLELIGGFTLPKQIRINGILANSSNDHTIDKPVALGWSSTGVMPSAAATIEATAGTLHITGVVHGTIPLCKMGPGTLSLDAMNTFNTKTTIKAGTLNYGATGAFTFCSDVEVQSGSTLTFSAPGSDATRFNLLLEGVAQQNSQAIFLKELTGITGDLQLSGEAPCVVNQSTATSYSGKISGGTNTLNTADNTAGSRFIKQGSGTLTLSSSSSNFCGRIFVEGGILKVNNGNALGASSTVPVTDFTKNVFLSSGATLEIENSITIAKQFHINGTLCSSSGSNTISRPISIGWIGGTVLTPSPATIKVNSGSLTISSEVHGSEGLTKTGAGQLIFTGGTTANTLTGKINVVEGELNLCKTAGTDAIAGDVDITATGILKLAKANQINTGSTVTLATAGATFDMDGNTDTFRTLNFLNGILTQGGATLNLNAPAGTDALSMGAVMLTGPIVISNGGRVHFNATSGTGDIANINFTAASEILVDNGTAACDLNFSGTSGGAGAITKKGSGTLQFSGAAHVHTSFINDEGMTKISGTLASPITLNTGTVRVTGTGAHTGDTTMAGGTMIIDSGASTTGTVNVNGGIFRGTGSVNGPLNVNSGGIFEPGMSIGTMCVNGDLSFSAGSTLLVEVDANLASFTGDLLQVDGNVTIDPNAKLNIVALPNAMLTPAHTFSVNILEIKNSGGTINAPFLDICLASPLVQEHVVQTDTLIKLELNVLEFSTLFNSGNTGQIAAHLDSVNPPLGSDLGNVITALTPLTMEELEKAFDILDPSQLKSLPVSQQNNSVRMRQMVSRRLSDIYRKNCVYQDAHKSRATTWIEFDGDWYDQDRVHGERGFRSNSFQLQTGLDHIGLYDFIYGLTAGYSYTDVDWKGASDGGLIHAMHLGFYGSKYNEKWFTNVILQASIAHMEHERHILFPDVSRVARGKYYTQGALAHLHIGRIYGQGAFEWRPYALADYNYMHQDSFQETGADALNLIINRTSNHFLRSEGGVQLLWCANSEHFKFLIDGKLAYAREDRFDDESYKGHFVSVLNHKIEIKGLNPDRNLFSPALAITLASPCEKWFLRLGYVGEFGKNHEAHNAHLKGGFDF